jgi:hypothetical protein
VLYCCLFGDPHLRLVELLCMSVHKHDTPNTCMESLLLSFCGSGFGYAGWLVIQLPACVDKCVRNTTQAAPGWDLFCSAPDGLSTCQRWC